MSRMFLAYQGIEEQKNGRTGDDGKMSPKEREDREAEYLSFLNDALAHRSITEWEERFLLSLKNGFERGYITVMEDLSDKQRNICDRIERKIYDIG